MRTSSKPLGQDRLSLVLEHQEHAVYTFAGHLPWSAIHPVTLVPFIRLSFFEGRDNYFFAVPKGPGIFSHTQ